MDQRCGLDCRYARCIPLNLAFLFRPWIEDASAISQLSDEAKKQLGVSDSQKITNSCEA